MKNLFRLGLFIFLLTAKFPVIAQVEEQKNSAEIYQDLLRLNTLGTVLYIAAHPDDENTRLLSWLVGEKKVRAAYVSLTRGDGGQNLIGSELGPLLGVIRTQELLAARKVDGAEQYFTRAVDFGYSKNPEETLQKWNEDTLLKDLVHLIRKIQPDVVILRFPPDARAGHGHHSASAILGHKAFLLAGDKNYQPEGGLQPWQPQRLFWNTYYFSSGINTTSDNQLKVNFGTYNSILGKSYGEISSESRSQHKSQGFGTATTRGDSTEYFLQLEGKEVESDLLENINTTWSRIPGSKKIQRNINKAIKKYQTEKPSAVLPNLLSVRKEILRLLPNADAQSAVWLEYKLIQTDELIRQAAGIWATVIVKTNELTPGDTITAELQWIHRSDIPIELKSVTIGNDILIENKVSKNNKLIGFSKQVTIPENLNYSAPYWLENPMANNLFHSAKDIHGNAAYLYDNHPVEVKYSIAGQDFTLNLPLNVRNIDPVDGESFTPAVILPAVTMQWSAPFSIHPNGKEEQVRLKIMAHTDIPGGKLHLQYPSLWNVQIVNGSETIPALKKDASHNFTLSISTQNKDDVKDTLSASVEIDGQNCDLQLYNINYEHIPRQTVLTRSELPLTSFTVKTQAKKIGYIEGAGDLVPQSLEQLGYEIVSIDEYNYKDISWKELDAVVTGIRAYNKHLWLNDAYDVIMDYVRDGGNLVVQYNTNNFFGPLIAKMFPYDLEITKTRVTVEGAPVAFVDSDAKILNSPNRITQKDFDGWVQERGIYFAGERSPEWNGVLSMNDPGEPASDGSLLWAKYGEGALIYTGLVFFRELPAGVPGAYRLFINLLEANK